MKVSRLVATICLSCGLLAAPAVAISSLSEVPEGALIKSTEYPAVYYYTSGQRFVFPNEKTFYSWYDNFIEVLLIDSELLASIPLGGNVTYRPGKHLVKIVSDPKVYVVEPGGVLRWVKSEELAQNLYGVDWRLAVHDIPDAFFVNYLIDETRPMSCTCGFVPSVITATTPTIAHDKNVSR